ncbi:N-formylglutamate amidohydrolase, partial [Paraburkholderia heleia]|uniref:N-formylglutamate amidohydrolase n=1 Tax=Paraburkholderia heleia TaxID=634127 RepID=UPI0031CE4547
TAAAAVQAAVERAAAASGFTWIANGRFKGGYNTRHYGAPHDGVHAVQLEMCQSTYMSETAPFDYEPALAQKVQPVLREMAGGALAVIEAMNAAAA